MFPAILAISLIVIDFDEIALEIFVKNLSFLDWGIKSIPCTDSTRFPNTLFFVN